MRLDIQVKYGGLPSVKGKFLFDISYALGLRALFFQKNKKMDEFRDMAENIDYSALEKMASSVGAKPEDLLSAYFSVMGYEKEYKLYVLEDAEAIINLLEKNKPRF